ncbi:allantoate amidohydrolase [Solwaraspora sp. WMMD406]|uniref:allantoate amidohydrolase n=1 Tax=Solwaraspora sp. WMMD406 TaxID=3016095 RepID=UPI00241801BE|nr:allantoate amidohydrolase [Solwaraspora sp. WMMD406]MDG4767495.1 allantoate amidohydrolase [Solwaraspora sp. WMMD406]
MIDQDRLLDRFRPLWAELAEIGRDPDTGGYLRYAWSAAELACRRWFVDQAARRDLTVSVDGNGNLWARWLPDGVDPATAAVVTGSHFDSVPHGGGYDGPLGVVSAFLAVDELRDQGFVPGRPITVAAFVEEEGSRFGVACLGSRLLTGGIAPRRALALRDRSGVSLAEAMAAAGADPAAAGPDPQRLAGIKAFVELHIEQGRALVDLDAPVGVASMIWPHGRWRLEVSGEGNHAGTTRMADRRDPMLTCAYAVLAADAEARRLGAHATVGRIEVRPNATNAIPVQVRSWLDARAADAATLAELVEAVVSRAHARSVADGTTVTVVAESASPPVEFDPGLARRLVDAASTATSDVPATTSAVPGSTPVPVLPTAAGHDAGILAGHVPTAMIFVRNPSGVSHAPAEAATDADCVAGIRSLAAVLAELAAR